MDFFAVVDTETNWNDQVMSIGIVIADARTYELKDEKYYVFSPEYQVGGMYIDVLMADRIPNTRMCSRSEALKELDQWLKENGVDSLYAYNASFDMNHLSEFSDFKWFDIMRLAAYKQCNSAIPENAECFGTGKLKRNYGVEAITRLLSGNSRYYEIHNALKDAEDELNIMRMLNHQIDDYQCAQLCGKKISNDTRKNSTTGLEVKKNITDELRISENRLEYSRTPLLREEYVNNSGEDSARTCSAADAANVLGVSKSTVYNLINRGDIYATKKGNKYLVNIESVNQYIEAKKAAQRRATIISLTLFGVMLIFVMFFLSKIL